MQTIADYILEEQIHESESSLVYRGKHARDGLPVILKLLKDAYPSPERLARFTNEYELLRHLNIPGIVRAYALEQTPEHWLMTFEDFGGESLNRLGLAGQLSLEEALGLLADLTAILGAVHQAQVIHKDLNPSNIVYNRTTGQIKLIDFGISTLLSRETPTFRSPNVLEGTLAYLSPEQTGRMNRTLDYRSDFYSLGVTMYELLTGVLPFNSNDALELVHSHIARQPPAPHERRPDLPRPLSAIVLKLLAKNAEDRYQSAYGILADIEHCLRQWKRTGHIAPFPLGQSDAIDQLMIPQQLYGRETEIAALLGAFAQVSEGTSELLLVSGNAGVGKSLLVQELHRPVTSERGYFVAGKFDQLQRATPYAALIAALRTLLRHILTESDNDLARWRARLSAVLGANAAVIGAVLPEIELILGPSAPALELEPAERLNRFYRVFQDFLYVLAQPEHPLVLVLEDIQWADNASLALLERLLTGALAMQPRVALLIIGTYRTDEVAAQHPLHQTTRTLEAAGVPLHHVTLEPLALEGVTALLAETLHCTPENVTDLAALVMAKTNGNPFFLSEFLKALYNEGALTFDPATGRWRWNEAQIQAQGITDNVVDLLAGQIRRLSPITQALLHLAACSGYQFSLALLVQVTGQTPLELARLLKEPLQMGLVLPLDDSYRLLTADVPGLLDTITVYYSFAHDRIWQAVYEQVPPTERAALHWRIGQVMLRQHVALLSGSPLELANTPALEESLFLVVDQLSHSAPEDLWLEQEERDLLAALYARAGQKAHHAAAHDSAFRYVTLGMRWLDADAWQRSYDLALNLHCAMAIMAYLVGDAATLDTMSAEVITHARTLLDTIDIYVTRIQAHAARHQFREAIALTLPVLAELGITLPDAPTQEIMGARIGAIQGLLAGRSAEAMLELPLMNDPQQRAAMRLLASLFSVVYIGAPELMPLVVFEQVALSLQHGHTTASPFAYANYGLLLSGVLGDIETGAQFASLALRLLDRLDARAFRAKTLMIASFFLTHWTQHAAETLPTLQAGYRSGLETGDFEYAGYNSYMHTCHAFVLGHELGTLIAEFAVNDTALAAMQQERTRQQNGLYWQVARNLREQVDEPWLISGDHYDEQQALPRLTAANDVPSLANVYFCKLLLAYLFGRYSEAVAHADTLDPYMPGMLGSLFVPLYAYYDSLARLGRLLTTEDTPHDSAYQTDLERVAANQAQLSTWATHAPMNHRHRWFLVEAERARLEGRTAEAREAYDQAIMLAHQHDYTQDEALANERASLFYLARGWSRLARFYARDAHYIYQNWGALTKTRELEASAPWLLRSTPSDLNPTNRTITITRTSQVSSQFDLNSVVKAYQTIAGEIVLETLLAKLMHTLLENAGAQRGLLILNRNGEWFVEAEGTVDQATVRVLQSQPLEEATLPHTLVNYVARTRESIVLSDALRDKEFINDAYIHTWQPRSVLCAPLLHHGTLTGLLYLENRQAAGAFTADRLAVLNLLSGQVAVSIENANLYARQEELVARRTAELSQAYETVKTLNERLQSELTLARTIQRSLLPLVAPDWADGPDVICYSESAREVGGDLYAYHMLSPTQYVLAVGDVSGKGMPAALLMAVSVALFRATVTRGLAPGAFLEQMDAALIDYTRNRQQNCALVYLTITYLDSQAAQMQVSNAGCIAPIIKHRNGQLEWVDIGGLPLGVALDSKNGYAEARLMLERGAMLVLASDGVVEAMNTAGELFGFARLEQAVASGPHTSAADLMRHIRAAVEAFTNISEPHDDLTLLVVHI